MLHPPLSLVKVKGMHNGNTVEDYHRETEHLLTGDPDSPDDDGELLLEAPDFWSTDEVLGGSQVTYNCCTYAVGDVVGLSKADWISPNASDATEYTVPMTILLESYFKEIYSAPSSEIDWRFLENTSNLKDGDILCFVYSRAGQEEYAHVSKIVPRDGRNWLLSKLGRGPVVRSTIKSTADVFRRQFELVRVYRRAHSKL